MVDTFGFLFLYHFAKRFNFSITFLTPYIFTAFFKAFLRIVLTSVLEYPDLPKTTGPLDSTSFLVLGLSERIGFLVLAVSEGMGFLDLTVSERMSFLGVGF